MNSSAPRDVVKDARGLKSRAMNARDQGDLARAEAWIVEAETLLGTALAGLQATRAGLPSLDYTPQPGKHEVDVAEQLGHILGSKGGIYRRWKRYEDSVDAYDAGYQQESWVLQHGRENSYCLVQRLVARVFISKGTATAAGLVRGVPLHASLVAAQAEVARQLGPEGHRGEDEYAAADAALVAMLLGGASWHSVVESFVNASPKPTAFSLTATLDVVRDLHQALVDVTGPAVELLGRLDGGARILESSLDELLRASE